MLPVICAAYLPPVSFLKIIAGNPEILVEQYDHYVKQTYRNRCVIAAADGCQTLTVPVVKAEHPGQLMRDVRISGHGNWKHLHWNAIVSAYMNSPYFMYYEDDFRPIYERHHTFLLDFNMELLWKVIELSGISASLTLTQEYHPSEYYGKECDLRGLVDPDMVPDIPFKPYYQVFRQKNGFLPNLSAVDILFNMGPETLLYL